MHAVCFLWMKPKSCSNQTIYYLEMHYVAGGRKRTKESRGIMKIRCVIVTVVLSPWGRGLM